MKVQAKLNSLRGHENLFNQYMEQAEDALARYEKHGTEDERAV